LKKGQLISFQDFGLARKVPSQQSEQVHAVTKSKH
jgi:hypothetical protein